MKKSYSLLLAATMCLSLATAATAATLQVAKVTTQPTVDGNDEDVWNQATPLIIDVDRIPEDFITINKEMQKGKYAKNWTKTKHTTIKQVQMRALYTDEEIYFQARWKDETKDDQHKPWVWNKTNEEYTNGEEREDRLAFQFPISGTFTSSMLSGAESVMDVWQWKAARTNPGNYIHDKSHTYSKTELKGKFSTHYTGGGEKVYIVRESDGGEAPYKSNKIDPFTYQGDMVANYIPVELDNADGKDVKAKGNWADGYWTVEISRKLNTGNTTTDTVFDPAKDSMMNIAVFDRVGDHFHATSDTVAIVFNK